MHPQLIIHPEVKEALANDKPLVALESTLITHGFPFPENVNVASSLENEVRAAGAVPATIAILEGALTVGLTPSQLERLGTSKIARKCSVRDLPLVMATKADGATTVAATMKIAHWAGITVFATGGIGGVHRGDDGDISADLMELGRTPITVVCAGIKGFLDLPASLEFLETQAVPVVGFETDEFPAFYSRQSGGLPVDYRADSIEMVREVVRARDEVALQNAILLVAPVPAGDEWPLVQAQPVIEAALHAATVAKVKGKAVTPFVLAEIARLSKGQSMKANMALLRNNATVAARLAVSLHS